VVQHPAHSPHQIHPRFGTQVSFGELLRQVQKLFSLVVIQEASQPGFPSGFSRPRKASAHGVCGIQAWTGFGSRSRLPISWPRGQHRIGSG
jgi:hypothetical protein